MRSKSILMALVGVLLLAACHRTPVEAVQLHRFEKVLFDTDPAQLPAQLQQVRQEYSTDLLNVNLDSPEFMQMLQGFVADPVMRDIYRITDSLFGDMRAESQSLGEGLANAQALIPDLRYDKVYTYVSGTFDYNRRVGCNGHELIISLDQYALPYTARYGYFSSPMFLVMQSRREYLPVDCMTAIARWRIAMPEGDMTLLDYMVAEGKAIYFAQQALPHAHDSLLMRYTASQLDWMKHNEEHVWAYLLQNKLLYETDYMRFHNLIDDAPKTNAFRDSSPRTTDYIGWHIVQHYVERTHCTMQQLFDQSDSQLILSQSNYHP